MRLSQLILLNCCIAIFVSILHQFKQSYFSPHPRMMCLCMKRLNEKLSWLTFLIHVLLVPKTCSLNLCRNGATCLEDRPSNPCLCAPGYSGRYCTGKSLHVHIQTGHWRFYILDSELLKINLIFQTDCIKLRDPVSSVPKSGVEKNFFQQILPRSFQEKFYKRNFQTSSWSNAAILCTVKAASFSWIQMTFI